jgi:hypothetical protein
MRDPRKPGRKAASRPSAQKKSPEQKPHGGDLTWPRLDLVPPEHVLGALRDWGRVILTSGYLNDVDRAVVEQAIQQLRRAEAELPTLLGRVSLLSRYPSLSRKLLEMTAAIAGTAYVIGAHGAMTDTARVFFEKSRATQMRYRRATSSQERELRAAIETLVEASKGSIPSGRPYKDAESIMDEVNVRLSKPVGVDAIARRIAALFKNSKK